MREKKKYSYFTMQLEPSFHVQLKLTCKKYKISMKKFATEALKKNLRKYLKDENVEDKPKITKDDFLDFKYE